MALSRIPFASAREADLRLDFVANEAKAMGCTVYSYWKMDPKGIHASKSFHYDWSSLGGGRTRALDINFDGKGVAYEVAFLTKYILPLVQSQGLSITAGLNGYVTGHSGSMTHAHVDPGSQSNLGGGLFSTPWGGHCSATRNAPSVQRLEFAAWKALQTKLGVAADSLPGKVTGKVLQAALNKKGAKLAVDGIIGPQTWKAVQRSLKIGVDGVPGRQTWTALAANPEAIVA